MEMPIQVVVSPDTGAVTEMFIWEENGRYQAAVKYEAEENQWHAYLEGADNGPDAELSADYILVGYFPTLHAALNELSAPPHEGAPIAMFSGTRYGDVVVG